MKHLVKYTLFELSGTELVGHMGPNYGDQKIPNTIGTEDTEVLYSESDDKFYTKDDYDNLYNDYLKTGGKDTTLSNFTKENLDKILSLLN